MATELKYDDEENQDQLSAAPEGDGGGGSMAPAPAAPSRMATPTGRPNVQQYLQANIGAGQRLAGGITEKTEKQAKGVEQGIGSARGQLEASSRPLEQKLGEEGSQKIQTAFKDPSALLNQQDQLSEFQRLRTGGYQGDIQNLGTQAQGQQQNIQGQVNQLGQQTKLAGTEGGRYELLKGTYGQPSYSRGQQRLDQLFLQAQPGATKNLQQNLQGIQQQQQQGLAGLTSEAQARLGALENLSGTRKEQWDKLFQGGAEARLESDVSQRGIGDIDASSQTRLQQAQEAAAQVPGLRERLASNTLTAKDLAQLGLQAGQSIYDVNDLSQFINQQNPTPTLAGAADPAEVARYRALQQLAGDTSGDLFGGATEIGGFKPYDFQGDELQSQIAASKERREVTEPLAELKRVGNINTLFNFSANDDTHGKSKYYGDMAKSKLPALQKAKTIDEMEAAINSMLRYAPTRSYQWADNLRAQLRPLQQMIANAKKGRGNVIKETPEDMEDFPKVT